MRSLRILAIALLMLQLPPAQAFVVSGNLNDPGNLALVASDLGAPLFGDDFEIANNVALHQFTVSAAGTVTFDSNGFAAGGVDPYFTLFSGFGNVADFLASNYAQAFATGGDFLISLALVAGDYTIALGAFANLSFAENLGAGTLGDGFISLGVPGFLGNSYYELSVTTDDPPPQLPEPSTLLLVAIAGLGLLARGRRRVVLNAQVPH